MDPECIASDHAVVLEVLLVVVRGGVRAFRKLVFKARTEFELHSRVPCRGVVDHGGDAQMIIAAQWYLNLAWVEEVVLGFTFCARGHSVHAEKITIKRARFLPFQSQ